MVKALLLKKLHKTKLKLGALMHFVSTNATAATKIETHFWI